MSRRSIGVGVTAGLLVGALLLPGAGAATPRGAAPVASVSRVGRLAFVTSDNQVELATVKVTGKTTNQTVIGPVTAAPAGRKVAIQGLTSSGDGNWVAWDEIVTKRNGTEAGVTPTLVIKEISPNRTYTLNTSDFPIGFAGDDLVTSGSQTSRVVLSPSPHLQKVPGGNAPQAAYPNGTVGVTSLSSPPGKDSTQQLRLTAFDGTATILHNYVMSPTNTHFPDESFVSADGKHLVVERGDHTDFGGIGPSSDVDEYSLDGHRSRAQLGHFGSAAAQWRVAQASFAWHNDEPWVVWYRATKRGAKTAIAVYQNYAWKKILPGGIAVAGNPNGFVVVQAGKYVLGGPSGLQLTLVPSGDAILQRGTITKVLGIQGTAFAWVS